MFRVAAVRCWTMTVPLIVGCCWPAAGQVPAPGRASIAISDRNGAPAIAVRNLPEALLADLAARAPAQDFWGKLFPVRVVDENNGALEEQANVLGYYAVRDRQAIFTPRYPLSTRVSYRVEFHPSAIGHEAQPLHALLRLKPSAKSAATRVSQVYPSADVLPANLLKFYIYFSGPMSRGMGHEHIRLLRSDGTVVEDPFPEIGVELWDGRQRRFTVLLDPGRIKRGIRINEEMGLPLVPGNRYRLVIDAAWPDAQGNPLSEGYAKSFEVTEPDHTSPDPDTWRVESPSAGSHDPLTVTFPESLDAALLERLLWIVDPSAEEIVGRVTLDRAERRWLLRPDAPWTAATYTLRVHPRLEDLAGNQIRRPFERDINKSAPAAPDRVVNIPVVIR